MTTLSTQTFPALVRSMATAVQSAASGLIDFTVGSILLAVTEAIALVALWLQGLVLALLETTRLATSTGSDVDSFGADFAFFRLPASSATGNVTFSRFSILGTAFIPVGSTVQTADGSQVFTVIADDGNVNYSDSLSGYTMGVGVNSTTAKVQANTPGAGANAAIGAISVITSALPGVDQVTNATAFTNGANAETDAAYKARFVNYIASLSEATPQAIGYAISSVQQGLTYSIVEDYTYGGSPQAGYFYVVVDDGSGSPSSNLLAAVSAAINLVRGCGISYNVYGPTVTTANVVLTATAGSTTTHAVIAPRIQAAITAYINALPVGAGLAWSRLIEVAYDAAPGIANITSLTLNSTTIDIAAATNNVVRAGTVTVS